MFQGASSAIFATEERGGVPKRYVEHSDRAKIVEGVPWGSRSRSIGEVFGPYIHGERLKIRIAAPPADGRANRELLKFLAASFGVPLSAVKLETGAGSRQKKVRIERPTRLIEGISGA